MSDSDDDWVPEKARRGRKSIAPRGKRTSIVPKITVSVYNDKVNQQAEAKENLQPPRRRSIIPKAPSALKPDSSLEINGNTESNTVTAKPVSSRRKSIATKILSTFELDSDSIPIETNLQPFEKTVSSGLDSNPKKEFNFPTSRRLSIIPKPSLNVNSVEPKDNKNPLQVKNAIADHSKLSQYEFTSLNQCLDDKPKPAPLKKRKSVAPKAVSKVSKAPIISEDKSNLQRRKSVVCKEMPVLLPLQNDRDKFEEDIKSYSGDDPLSVWYKYFKWVEQNFLKGGKDGPIVPLMQRCLRALDSHKKYYSDKRFFEIWLKFASVSQTPAKVYNHMFNRKIGCEFAKLFTEWATVLELEGKLTLADEVLKKGVDCQAEPIKELKSYWSQFKTRTASNVVPDSKELKEPPPPKNSVPVAESKNNCTDVQEVQSKPEDIPPKISDVKDASAKPSSSKQSYGLPNEPFRLYRQSCYMNSRMSVLPRESNLTKAEHEPEDYPVALFEPPDPMKVPMYDKDKVYASSGEMSFEEIRAAAWFKLEKSINLEQKLSEFEAKIAEQAELIKLLQEENASLKMALDVQKNQIPAKNCTCHRSLQAVVHSQTSDVSTVPDEDEQSCSSDISRKKHPDNVELNKTKTSRQVKPRKNDVTSTHFPHPVPETSSDPSIAVDPFDEHLKAKFLLSLNLSDDYYGSLGSSKERIGELNKLDMIKVGNTSYTIEDLIAQGSYGKVYTAVEQHSSLGTSKSKVALKVTKNASNWEIYACITLHRRLEDLNSSPNVLSSAMKVTSSHKYANAIIFTNELSQKGTLLDMVNTYRMQKLNVPELLAMYITWELLQLVSQMHKCQIIHADIKPDNVLIRDKVTIQEITDSLSLKTVLIKLIDFGRVIDLTFFEKGVCFSTFFKKDNCIEMIEKKPWVFQIDWFGLLNCVHVLLFADYMKVKKQANGRWFIEKKLRRHWDQTIWLPLFDELLNIPSCYQEPDVETHCNRIISKLQQNIKNFKF